MLLRFVTCAAFGFWAFEAYQKDKAKWGNTFALVGLLYNPFVPVELSDRDLWAVVNVGTVGLVVASGFVLFGWGNPRRAPASE